MHDLVIDTSLIAKWYLKDEEGFESADKILEDFKTATVDIFLPTLAIYELGNTFFVSYLRKRLTKDLCKRSFTNLLEYPFVYRTPPYEETLNISLKHNVSFYDASYLALALTIPAPFYTGDNRLYKKLRKDYKIIRSLKEY